MASNDLTDIKNGLDSVNELLQRFVTVLSEWKVANDKHMVYIENLAQQITASMVDLEKTTIIDAITHTDVAPKLSVAPVKRSRSPKTDLPPNERIKTTGFVSPLAKTDLSPNKKIKTRLVPTDSSVSPLADIHVTKDSVKQERDVNENDAATAKKKYPQPFVVLSPLKIKLEKADSMVVIDKLNEEKAVHSAKRQNIKIHKIVPTKHTRLSGRITRSNPAARKSAPDQGRVERKGSAQSKLVATSSSANRTHNSKMKLDAGQKKKKMTVQQRQLVMELTRARTSGQKSLHKILKRNSLL